MNNVRREIMYCILCNSPTIRNSNIQIYCKLCSKLIRNHLKILDKIKHKEYYDNYNKKYHDKHRDDLINKSMEYKRKNKDKISKWNSEYNKRYNKKNRKKVNLRHLTRHHIKIEDDQLCEKCYLEYAIIRHHWIYNDAKDVTFVCRECHKEIHKGILYD